MDGYFHTLRVQVKKLICVLILSSLFLCMSKALCAQDSSLIKTIENETHRIYDRTDKQRWFLTKKKLISFADTLGTEITVYSYKDTINRIVCTGYNNDGQWGVEFYISEYKLIFVYYSKSFFENDTITSAFINWKGYPCIEMRIYYNSDQPIGYTYNGIKNDKEVLQKAVAFPNELKKFTQWINDNIQKF